MKPNLLRLSQLPSLFGKGVHTIFRRFPVEYLLFVYTFVIGIISYHDKLDFEDRLSGTLLVVPAFIMGAYICNRLFPRGKARVVYYLVLPAFVLFVGLIPSCNDLVGVIYFTTTFIVLPVGTLLCHKRCTDRSFCEVAIGMLTSGVVAFIIGALISMLLAAIIYSACFIFGIDLSLINDLFAYTEIGVWTLVVSAVLLAMLQQVQGYRIADIDGLSKVFNWILTPAVCIYLLILYAYSVKIVGVWQLPKGGIANLVFGFMVFAILMQALSLFIPRSPFRILYRWLGVWALPALILFWCSALRRVVEYGFTPWRVYMILCGLLITFHALLFLFRYSRRYTLFSSVLIIGFLAIAVVPAWRAEAISLRSQTARVRKAAVALGVSRPNSDKLSLSKLRGIDTSKSDEARMLYESLRYIADNDTIAFARFGVGDMDRVAEYIPPVMRNKVIYNEGEDTIPVSRSFMSLLPEKNVPVSTTGYTQFYYMNMLPNEQKDSILSISLSGKELRFTQRELVEHVSAVEGKTPAQWKISCNRNFTEGGGERRMKPEAFAFPKGEYLILFDRMIWNCGEQRFTSLHINGVFKQ